MKSESKKTNVPGVTARVCDARCSTERSSQSGGPAVLARPEALVSDLDQLPLPLRLPPVRIAVRIVEVADEAARRACAGEHELDDRPHRHRLVEPRQRSTEARHLRTPIADDDDLRRFFGEPLADDELVAPLRGGQPRRRRPVDRVHVVAGPVRPRAGDVGARASPQALHRSEREPDHAAARDERKTSAERPARVGLRSGQTRAGLATPRSCESRRADPLPSLAAARARGSSAGTPRSPPTSSGRARTGDEARSEDTTRWTRTGANSRSMSSGTT